MIHFIPESPRAGDAGAGPYAEAIARLSSIREALACVEQFAGSQPSDSLAEAKLAAAWPVSSAARQRCFEARSAKAAAAAAAGLEALARSQDEGQPAHPAAVERLRSELATGLQSIDQLFSL
jgi:hypothetical protein